MRYKELFRYGLLLIIVFLLWYIASDLHTRQKRAVRFTNGGSGEVKMDRIPMTAPSKHNSRCGSQQSCPPGHFSFFLKTGVANVIGPRICFEGQVVMSGIHNNIGQGLNIVLVNAVTGEVEKYDFFNMYSGNIDDLLNFLKDIKEGTVILVASFDDSATKMTDEVREIFISMGSSHIKSLQFRDLWLFVGAKGTTQKSPFEKIVKNDKETNFFNGWPGVTKLEGCFPQKLDQ
ncbi:protein FAM3D [Arapaima gigas]